MTWNLVIGFVPCQSRIGIIKEEFRLFDLIDRKNRLLKVQAQHVYIPNALHLNVQLINTDGLNLNGCLQAEALLF